MLWKTFCLYMARSLLDTSMTIPENFYVGLFPEYSYAVKLTRKADDATKLDASCYKIGCCNIGLV